MTEKGKHTTNIDLITKFLSNEASIAETKQLQEWRNSSDLNEKEFKAIEKLWNISNIKQGNELINIDSEWNILQNKISPKGKTITLRTLTSIAASIALFILLSVYAYKYTQTVSTSTTSAEILAKELPDGSKVSLNANSKIKYNKHFGEKNRMILLQGEGFFDVTKNKKLPFKIETDIAYIEVVGTEFNVNAYKSNSEVKVTVTEGTVWIYAKKESKDTLMVNAGETGIFRKSTNTAEKIGEIDLNDLGWETKSFDFNDTALKEVCEKLSNAYHVVFELDPKVEHCIITVSFDQKELGTILKLLKNTLNLRIGKKGDAIYITGEGCN